MLIRRPRGWEIPEREATPEESYLSRRAFLGAGVAALTLAGCQLPSSVPPGALATIPRAAAPYPLRRNTRYALDRPLTDELVAATHNNFYEFTTKKGGVWQQTGRFRTDPWTLEVTGLVSSPLKLTVDELLHRFPSEERLYRHRCIEAWAMAVPWSGIPLASLLHAAQPKANAHFVRFISFSDPEQMPGVKQQPSYPWPYYEGLGIDEAMNELAFLATGSYGHPLPKQHGAPVRLVVPWKYGFKSAKSIVRIELVEAKPHTFWEDEDALENPFESNVDPSVPHPRWSQATEHLIGTFDIRRTLPYNGYGEFVRHLYRT